LSASGERGLGREHERAVTRVADELARRWAKRGARSRRAGEVAARSSVRGQAANAGSQASATTLIAGIAGAQGSGKTTLARALVPALAERGLRALTLSLDDFYLTRDERAQLGREVHPLLAMRGVPGTHDVALAHATLDALCELAAGTAVGVPRFDKGRDDRVPRAEWPEVCGPIEIVLLEGWCLGAKPARGAERLAAPLNALEREEDPEGAARYYSELQLAGPYQTLFARLQWLAFLRVPDLDSVRRWRGQQEHELRAEAGADAPATMRPAELERFISSFERITRRMLARPPDADLTLQLDGEHRVIAYARMVRRGRSQFPAGTRSGQSRRVSNTYSRRRRA
jgi:D-glycerate 3-kinase